MMHRIVLALVTALAVWCGLAETVETGRVDLYDQATYVTFDANGGSGTPLFWRIKKPCWKKLPSCRYVREGYVFAGWCDSCGDCGDDGDCPLKARSKVWIGVRDQVYQAVWKKLWNTKPRTYCGYVIGDSGSVTGLVFVKVGAPNLRTGSCRVNATVLSPNAKKITYSGKSDDGTATLIKKKAHDLYLEMTETSLGGEVNGMEIIGAPVPDQVTGYYRFSTDGWEPEVEGAWQLMPEGVEVEATSRLWITPVKGHITIIDGELVDCLTEPNPCNVQLKYNPLSGKISGSFTAISGLNVGINFLVKTKYTVQGVMVDGVGYGFAVSKRGGICDFSLIGSY